MPGICWQITLPQAEWNKKLASLGRTHIGIYTVLNESFSPQEELLVLKYIKYSCALQPSP